MRGDGRVEGSHTFVPGQISAHDDDEAQGDEDHHGHHSADQSVVGHVLCQSVGIWKRGMKGCLLKAEGGRGTAFHL